MSDMITSNAEDFVMERYDGFMDENFQPVKDPFYMELSDGKRVRRKMPAYCTKKETKTWKRLQNRAWFDDRSFLGCGLWWVDCGVGWATVLLLIPVIGPIFMYRLHSKTVELARRQYGLPTDLMVKLHGNIMFDLLISLPPVIGTFLGWMNGCSTRNVAIIYNYVCKVSWERHLRENPMQQPAVPVAVGTHIPAPAPAAAPAAAGASNVGGSKAYYHV